MRQEKRATRKAYLSASTWLPAYARKPTSTLQMEKRERDCSTTKQAQQRDGQQRLARAAVVVQSFQENQKLGRVDERRGNKEKDRGGNQASRDPGVKVHFTLYISRRGGGERIDEAAAARVERPPVYFQDRRGRRSCVRNPREKEGGNK